MRTLPLATLVVATLGCRATLKVDGCRRESALEVWVERRFPSQNPVADTTRADLSVALGRDSTVQLPAGSMTSILIAGPAASEAPDTVRLLTALEGSGVPLWRGHALRPGTYTVSLTTPTYVAGPRDLALAPGERIELELTPRRQPACGDAQAVSHPQGGSGRAARVPATAPSAALPGDG